MSNETRTDEQVLAALDYRPRCTSPRHHGPAADATWVWNQHGCADGACCDRCMQAGNAAFFMVLARHRGVACPICQQVWTERTEYATERRL